MIFDFIKDQKIKVMRVLKQGYEVFIFDENDIDCVFDIQFYKSE